MANNTVIDFSDGRVFKKMLTFALPIVISGLVQDLFNAADAAVVGQFCGRTAVSAVTSTSAIVNLLISLFMGIAVGVNVVISKYYGAKDAKAANRASHTSVLQATVFGVAICVVSILLSDKMLEITNVPEEVFGKAKTYLMIYFIGIPFSMVYNSAGTVIKAAGDTVRPLIYIIIGGAVNVVLNIVFVVIFRMDVAGVAIASVIATALSAVLTIIHMFKADEWYRLSLKNMKVDITNLKTILKIGVPAGIQSTMFAISHFILQSSINKFGNAAMSGSGAGASIECFVYVVIGAFGQTALNFVSNAVGAKRFDLIKKITLECIGITVCFSLIVGVTVSLFGEQLLSIYLPDDTEAISYGVIRLWLTCGLYAICAVPDTIVGSIRGMGDSLFPMLISLICVCGLRILWIYTVFAAFSDSFAVLFACQPITWVIAGIADCICYSADKRKLMRLAENQ